MPTCCEIHAIAMPNHSVIPAAAGTQTPSLKTNVALVETCLGPHLRGGDGVEEASEVHTFERHSEQD
jgi:hypothetical protein